jgi:hypothetical protein
MDLSSTTQQIAEIGQLVDGRVAEVDILTGGE